MSGGGDRPRRVRHPAYGIGSVVARERGGLVLRVRFDDFPGLDVGLPATLLRLVEEEGAPSSAVSADGEPTPQGPAAPL